MGFRIKRNADGSLGKYRACLVEKGVMQVHGTDYFDTFSPVAKLSSFRTTLTYAACCDWEFEKFTDTDVRQCFAVYLTSMGFYMRISEIFYLATHWGTILGLFTLTKRCVDA